MLWKRIVPSLIILAWIILALYLSVPWVHHVAQNMPLFLAWLIIIIANVFPGIGIIVITNKIIQTKQNSHNDEQHHYPPVTILIPTVNDGDVIFETLDYISRLEYPNHVDVKVIKGITNEEDKTVLEVSTAKRMFENENFIISCHEVQTTNRSILLNSSLKLVDTSYFVVVNPGVICFKHSIRNLMAHMLSENRKIATVGGHALVRNSRENILTKSQEWDYFLNMGFYKKIQNPQHTSFISTAATKAYETEAVINVGGWDPADETDLSISYRLYNAGYYVEFEPLSIGFRMVPDTWGEMISYRFNWQKERIKVFKRALKNKNKRILTNGIIKTDYFLVSFQWIFLLCFLPTFIIGLMYDNFFWLGLLYLGVIMFYFLQTLFQKQQVFDQMGLTIRKNYAGFLSFISIYWIIMSFVSFCGQIAGFFSRK